MIYFRRAMAETFVVWRQVEFSAAHRLYREDWSESENHRVFGKCANPFGHGHNYQLDVAVRGPLDEATGMVVHFQDLKRVLAEVVVEPLDHKHLNHDAPLLAGKLPTSENLVRALWRQLERAFAGRPWTLDRLVLSSTEKNRVEYAGPG